MQRLGPPTQASFLLVVFTLFFATPGLYPQEPQTSEAKPKGVQVGQVLVTPLAVGTISPSPLWGLKKPPKKGYHFVVVSLRVQNTTLYPNCTDWIPKILTDAGHSYGSQIFRAPDPPELEHLPFRAQSQGSYAFQVRDGEAPIGLSLERIYEVERACWSSKGFSPEEPFIRTVNISLDGLPEPTSPLQPTKPNPTK
ncbi:MAG TPA: hypothetical protein VJY15_20150 [Candidatus Acidoferrum sp.]|nr:hypothetical protein [Candidatus Acidoferrum sp.]